MCAASKYCSSQLLNKQVLQFGQLRCRPQRFHEILCLNLYLSMIQKQMNPRERVQAADEVSL